MEQHTENAIKGRSTIVLGTIIGLSLVLCTIMLGGCATVLASFTQEVSVTSQPAGAQVSVNGALQGSTPMVLSLPRTAAVVVRVTKPGYTVVEQRLVPEMDPVQLFLTQGMQRGTRLVPSTVHAILTPLKAAQRHKGGHQ